MTRIAFFLFLYCLTLSLKAQKLAGAEIYYRQLGSKTYLITAHVYRKCDGISLNNLNGFVISDTFKIPMNFARISISKINDTCGNPCNVQNSKSNPGYEKHTYTDTVNFAAAPYNVIVSNNLCQVKFAIHQYLRDFSTTTHSGGNGMFYLDAMLNLCVKLNDLRTPEFSFEPKFNYLYQQVVNYTPAPLAFNKEDSLVFDLAPALHDENTPANYTAGYSSERPMSPYCSPNPATINCTAIPSANPPRGFYFDNNRCEITFFPNRNNEKGTIKFKVSVYRKDSTNKFVLAAYTCREMSARVDSSVNKTPVLRGVANFSICQNTQLCMYQTASDVDTADEVFVEWNNGIQGANIQFLDPNSREKEMQFCWIPNAASGRRNFVAFRAYDKACNANMVSRNHLILKKRQAPVIRNYRRIACNALRLDCIPIDSVYFSLKNYTYNYRVFNINDPSKTLFSSNSRTDTFTTQTAASFGVEVIINNLPENCPYKLIDTFSLGPSKIEITGLKDTVICFNDSLLLGPLTGISNGYQLQWEYPYGKSNAGDTFNALRIKLRSLTLPVVLHVNDSGYCNLSDTLIVYAGGGFNFIVGNQSHSVCKNVVNEIRAVNINRQGTPSWTWFINGINQNVNDTFISRSFNSNAQIVLRASLAIGCSYSDTLNIIAIDKPVINLSDTSVCPGESVNLNPNPYPYPLPLDFLWYRNDTLLNFSDSFLDIEVNKTMSVKLRLENIIGCNAEKTVMLTALPLPLFNIVSDTFFNRYHQISMSTDKPFATYQWSTGASTRNNLFWAYQLGAPGAYTITCTVSDINACTYTDSIRIYTDKFSSVFAPDNSGFKIYPMPIDKQFYIETDVPGLLKIFSLDGRLISDQMLDTGLNLLDTGFLPAGNYLFQFGSIIRIIPRI